MLPNQHNKFLVVGPAWVGDLVMSQVLLQLLKKQDPAATIDVLAPAWARALLERMPEVQQIHAMPLGHGQLQLRERWQLGRNLVPENYSRAIVLPNSWKSAVIPFAAQIPQRTGWLGELRWGLLNDVRYLDKQQLPLMIQRFAALGLSKNKTTEAISELTKPKLVVQADSIIAALHKFDLQLTKPMLALCPGAEYGPAKRWPTDYYAQVAKQKLAEGWAVWLFGSAKDKSVAAEIQQQTDQRCCDLTGRTNLGEAVDLLSLAQAVVTNDSGLMHIAAALNRPIVAVYGSSSPRFTPPLAEKIKILTLGLACSPCFKRECPLGHLKCLTDLMPTQVLQAITELT